jgi:EmrB/QacA subfamily drug resistance transporter
MAGLMLSMFVAAMDSTAVGTALPTIAGDLHQFSLYPWIFTGYLLTSTTSVPLWGRLADRHGRRPVLMAGIALFVIASVLCGISPGMGWLIAFRTLQGVGAGCLQPLVMTVVGDIFPIRQRARLQGLFSGMWAAAAITGPLIGALFVSTIGWRWIFDINLPVGIVATWLLWGYREHKPAQRGSRLDVRSAVLLTAGCALLLSGLGTGSASASPNWPLAGAGAAVLVLFGWVEARTSIPTIPFDLLRDRVIGPAIFVSTLAGTIMFAATAYVPLYVQDGLGGTAFMAGAAVAPMSFGWPVASVIAGWTLVRVGYQRLLMGGSVALAGGSLMLLMSTPALGVTWVGASSAVIGFGMGLFAAPIVIMIQNRVSWNRRGAATALNQFSRTIGGAIGVSLMGVLMQSYVHSASTPSNRTALLAGIHADYAVVLVLAGVIVVAAVGILVTARPPAARAAAA